MSASATSGTAVATVGTNTVSWNGSIAGNGTVTITIVATVLPTAAGTNVNNQGSVAFDADGNGSNESTALTNDPGVAGGCQPTVFRALVTGCHHGSQDRLPAPWRGLHGNLPRDAQQQCGQRNWTIRTTRFTDVPPAGLTLVSASASNGAAVATVGNNTVTWNGSVPGKWQRDHHDYRDRQRRH